MSINATPGTTADSYITVVDANTYFNTRLFTSSVWEAATVDEKERALKQATRILDRMNWVGEKTTDAYALRWPRDVVYDQDAILLSSTTIPSWLEDATCESAIDLMGSDTTSQSGQDTALIKKVKAGSVEVEFNVPEGSKGATLQKDVMALIRFYLIGIPIKMLRA